MDKEAGVCFGIMQNLFKQSFDAAYETLPAGRRSLAALYVPVFFHRWLSSALLDDTLLTPYNLLRAQTCGESGTELYPRMVLDEKDRRAFSLELHEARIEGHPLIEDLKAFMHLFAGVGSISEMLRKSDPVFLNNFSVPSMEYVAYLSNLSVRLKLNKKLPSINSTVYIAQNDWPVFFNLPHRQILELAVSATIDECVERIDELLPVPRSFKQSLRRILAEPVPVGEIFRAVLDGVEIDYEHFFDLMHDGEGGLNDIFSEIMDLTNVTFSVGVYIDKYLIFPFSSYLKLIQPVYLLSVDLEEEFRALSEYAGKQTDLAPALYSPCSAYYLTDLGRKFFNTAADNGYRLPNGVSPAPIFDALELNPSAKAITPRLLSAVNKQSGEEIITLLVKPDKTATLSVRIETDTSATLEDLHDCLCSALELDAMSEYSFFMDSRENLFTTFSSENIKGRKAEQVTVGSFNFQKGRQFELHIRDTMLTFSLSDAPEDVWVHIEVLNVSKGKYGYLYPRVSGKRLLRKF